MKMPSLKFFLAAACILFSLASLASAFRKQHKADMPRPAPLPTVVDNSEDPVLALLAEIERLEKAEKAIVDGMIPEVVFESKSDDDDDDDDDDKPKELPEPALLPVEDGTGHELRDDAEDEFDGESDEGTLEKIIDSLIKGGDDDDDDDDNEEDDDDDDDKKGKSEEKKDVSFKELDSFDSQDGDDSNEELVMQQLVDEAERELDAEINFQQLSGVLSNETQLESDDSSAVSEQNSDNGDVQFNEELESQFHEHNEECDHEDDEDAETKFQEETEVEFHAEHDDDEECDHPDHHNNDESAFQEERESEFHAEHGEDEECDHPIHNKEKQQLSAFDIDDLEFDFEQSADTIETSFDEEDDEEARFQQNDALTGGEDVDTDLGGISATNPSASQSQQPAQLPVALPAQADPALPGSVMASQGADNQMPVDASDDLNVESGQQQQQQQQFDPRQQQQQPLQNGGMQVDQALGLPEQQQQQQQQQQLPQQNQGQNQNQGSLPVVPNPTVTDPQQQQQQQQNQQQPELPAAPFSQNNSTINGTDPSQKVANTGSNFAAEKPVSVAIIAGLAAGCTASVVGFVAIWAYLRIQRRKLLKMQATSEPIYFPVHQEPEEIDA